MATRPVFIPNKSTNGPFVITKNIEFLWFPGFSVPQKQKSILSLHDSIKNSCGLDSILEASSKSMTDLGVALSAFNLSFTTKKKYEITVESAFQASKVFERGGPYIDLIRKDSLEAKRDMRLKSSGRLIKFHFFGVDWPLEPKTIFYDWVYINALIKHKHLVKEVIQYNAFTDIEFNPNKSINCQAYSLALFVSLYERGLVEQALLSQESFIDIINKLPSNNACENEYLNPSLF